MLSAHVTQPAVVGDGTQWTMDSSAHALQTPEYCSRYTLTETEKDHLIELYAELHSVSRRLVEVSTICMKYSHISMHGKLLGSCNGKTASSSNVFIRWNYSLFGMSASSSERLAGVNFYCKHSATINGQNMVHLLANLSLFKIHPEHSTFGKPVLVWYHDLFEESGIYSLIPVQFIKCRSVAVIDKVNSESVLLTTPIIDF